MELIFKRDFKKDVKKISDKKILKKLKEILYKLEEVDSISKLVGVDIKPLKGAPNYYRIRIGNYRLGFKKEDNKLIILRFMHRKDIYKDFP